MDFLKNAREIRNNLLEQMKQDTSISEFLKDNELTFDFVENNFSLFYDFYKEQQQCLACKSQNYCKNRIKGCKSNLSYDNDTLTVTVSPCKFALPYAHKENYLINHLAEEYLLTDIDKISLSKESKQYSGTVNAIRNICNSPEDFNGFYIYGGLGCGKTYLASCVTNALAKQGKKVAFVNMVRLSSYVRSHLSEADDIISKMCSAYVLVLDDIGAEKVSEYIRDDVLFTVLDYRMTNSKLTFFTSNHSIEEIAERFALAGNTEDIAKASRIIERISTVAVEVQLVGKSRRK